MDDKMLLSTALEDSMNIKGIKEISNYKNMLGQKITFTNHQKKSRKG